MSLQSLGRRLDALVVRVQDAGNAIRDSSKTRQEIERLRNELGQRALEAEQLRNQLRESGEEAQMWRREAENRSVRPDNHGSGRPEVKVKVGTVPSHFRNHRKRRAKAQDLGSIGASIFLRWSSETNPLAGLQG